jgi:Virulence-associated protein E
VLAADPGRPLLIVEGEKDVITATTLGALAVTNADGAGKWTAEDTRTLIALGARPCPGNDAAGIDHGVRAANFFKSAGVETRWLELPELGAKEDLSDWAPLHADPAALLAELIANAPPFDAEALNWRSRLNAAGRNAGYTYRGDAPNLSLALAFEPRLKGRFAWNAFRHRIEVIHKTPWCPSEWWDATSLTPIGHRALRDADITELGNYLTHTYDFGACSTTASRSAINATAEAHIFDELNDWVDALPQWDGVARLDGWLVTYAGADTEAHEVEYLALIRSKFVMQVLNRALHPGAKAGYALAFGAIQGAYKDTTIDAMFAPYCVEGAPPPNTNQADFARALAGAMVVHIAEMSGWLKADAQDQKAALTRCVDHGRPAYGYEHRAYPRRACFIFSLNPIDIAQDATGDRRKWGVYTTTERVNIEALRRDRDQLLAEALHRLKSGERYWPTPEEEARLIILEQRKTMPEAALELLAALERYIVEAPLTTRPNRDDFAWKWEYRPQPLIEVYLDAFFGKCFGTYAAVKRQGLDRASKKDIMYCVTWLCERGWRRVEKRLPDGQKVRVWRAPGWKKPSAPAAPVGSDLLGRPTPEDDATADCTKSEREEDAADATGATGATDVSDGIPTQRVPWGGHAVGENPGKNATNQLLSSSRLSPTQKNVNNELWSEIFSRSWEEEKNTSVILLGKCPLGATALEGLLRSRSTASTTPSRATVSLPSTSRRPGSPPPAIRCARCKSRTAKTPP